MRILHYFNITYSCDSNCIFCAADVGIRNRNEFTITPDSFEKRLLESNVKAGDRIIINGGEPTLSPYFWEILEICAKFSCTIDLFTNGHIFSCKDSVKKIANYSLTVVRIPIFGFEDRHDYLTGVKGNYQKVIDALDNFSEVVGDSHINVNVKFLLCKATMDSNCIVFEHLFAKYRNLFKYTLSPLLISNTVIANKSELLLTYSEMLAESMNFIENRDVNCDLIPLCLLKEKKRNSILQRRKNEYFKIYNDSSNIIDNMENYNCDKCKECSLNRFCEKFPPSYIEFFGNSEINPL